MLVCQGAQDARGPAPPAAVLAPGVTRGSLLLVCCPLLHCCRTVTLKLPPVETRVQHDITHCCWLTCLAVRSDACSSTLPLIITGRTVSCLYGMLSFSVVIAAPPVRAITAPASGVTSAAAGAAPAAGLMFTRPASPLIFAFRVSLTSCPGSRDLVRSSDRQSSLLVGCAVDCCCCGTAAASTAARLRDCLQGCWVPWCRP